MPDSKSQTTKMTAAEAVDFLNVWGEAELKKVTSQTTATDRQKWEAFLTEQNLEFTRYDQSIEFKGNSGNVGQGIITVEFDDDGKLAGVGIWE